MNNSRLYILLGVLFVSIIASVYVHAPMFTPALAPGFEDVDLVNEEVREVFPTDVVQEYDSTTLEPQESAETVEQAVSPNAETFTLTGKTYGGNVVPGYEHKSFELDETGAYQYLPSGEGPQTMRTGALTEALLDDLASVLATADLNALSQSVTGKNCISHVDGIEHVYELEIRGTEYTFDTCTTAFELKTDMGAVFMRLWLYMYES